MFGILGQRFRDTQRKPALGAQLIPGHPLARGLVRSLLFNEGGGSTILDGASAQTGSLSTNNASPLAAWDANGLTFTSGNQDYIDLGARSDIAISGNITVELTFRFTTTSGNQELLNKGYSGATAYELYWVPASGLQWQAYTGSTGVGTVFAWSPAVGVTYSVVGTYNGTAWTLYINGVQVASTNSGTGPQSSSAPLAIGALRDVSAGVWKDFANITAVRAAVRNVALGPDEVAATYANPYAHVWSPANILYSFPAGAPPSGFKPWFANATKLAA